VELPPQLRALRDFYYKTARALPPERDFVHAPALIQEPTFFTMAHLKQHLNNPMLMPCYFTLVWQGKRVDCSGAVGTKNVQGVEVAFLNKSIVEDHLSRGASMVLEGVDILDPTINDLCAAIDAVNDCVFSNSVVFFSQKGSEAYRGHRDADDVLVIHLAGQKKWRIYERQPPRQVELTELAPEKLGRQQAELVMNPGDALFLRSCTPHQVETTGDHSLHMSFDIVDRHLNAETILELLLEEYKKDSAPCYTPADGIVQKLMAHAASSDYKARAAQVQAMHKENYARARKFFGANRIRALDRWLPSTSR
jgi:cupin superfamily protein